MKELEKYIITMSCLIVDLEADLNHLLDNDNEEDIIIEHLLEAEAIRNKLSVYRHVIKELRQIYHNGRKV